jgi:predicted nucleic acid-binding protein
LSGSAFFDSNIPLYLISGDEFKAGRAEELMAQGGMVSVQVLNEFAAVARRKHQAPWPAIADSLAAIKAVCGVQPLSVVTHDMALALAERYQLHVYDACIVASALEAGCDRLYTEDLQHGQRIETVTVIDPFL